MTTISASLVKELREKTNAGMMDCKTALVEAGGDLDTAADILRKKGITKAGKKAERAAKDGCVYAAISEDGKTGILLEVGCETDFVSKNENFRTYVGQLGDVLLANEVADLDAFLALPHPSGGTVTDANNAKIAEIGENIVIRRIARYSGGENTRLATYIHMQGRVGVILEAKAEKGAAFSNEDVLTAIKDITLHITASSPEFLSSDEVSEAVVAKEREIYAEQVKGKPENVIGRIVDGKMNKFYSQVCLLEQGFIKDPDKTVADLLKEVASKANDTVSIVRFERFAIGEG